MFIANVTPVTVEKMPDWIAVGALIVIAVWLMWGAIKRD